MSLQTNSLAAQAAPTRSLSSSTQDKPANTFGRILQDRMSPQRVQQEPRPAAVQKNAQPNSVAKVQDSKDQETEQTATGNSLPEKLTTAGSVAAEDETQDSDSDTEQDATAVLASGPGVVSVENTVGVAPVVAGTVVDAATTASSIAVDTPTIVTDSTASVAAVVTGNTGGSSVSGATVASTSTVTGAQPEAAAVTVAGGQGADTLEAKSPGAQSASAIELAAGQSTKQPTVPGTAVLPKNARAQVLGPQPAGPRTTGQLPPGSEQEAEVSAESLTGSGSEAKSAVQQLAAGLQAARQQVTPLNGPLSGSTNRSISQVPDGSTAIPTLLNTAQPGVLATLPAPTAATALSMPVGVPPGDPRWAQAFTDRVVWLAQGNVQTANIRLNPPELGRLDIQISLQKDQASILIASPQQAVRHILEATLPQLRQQFDNMGFVGVQAQVTDQQPQQRDQSAHTAMSSAIAESDEGDLGQPLVTTMAARTQQGLLDLYI